jgi:phage shock protein C
MPRKKSPGRKPARASGRRARRKPPRVATHEERVEHFAEEMGALGERAARAARQGRPKRLYRSGREKILGGVCGGIGEYFGVDPTLVRLLWVLFSLAVGVGVLFYIIAWIIIPRNPRHRW